MRLFSKNHLLQLLTINLFIFAVVVSSVSNSNIPAIALKIISVVITAFFFILPLKKYNVSIQSLLPHPPHTTSPIILLLLLIIIPLLSITWSDNKTYGLLKWIQLATNTIPLIILFFLGLRLIQNSARSKPDDPPASFFPLKDSLCCPSLESIFLNSVIFWSIVTSLSIIILNPIKPETIYQFNVSRWSHVTLGRFQILLLIIAIAYYINNRFPQRRLLLLISIFFLSLGITLSSLRAAILGMIIFVPVILIVAYIRKEMKPAGLLLVFGLIAVGIFGGTMLIRNEAVSQRISSLVPSNEFEIKGDGSSSARIVGFEVSVKRFVESPLVGIGFGGFNSDYEDYPTTMLKYPHNIILEFLLELGVVGLALFGWILYLIIKHTYKHSYLTLIFFLTALWLAFFSKDIPSNAILFLGLGYSLTNNNHPPKF